MSLIDLALIHVVAPAKIGEMIQSKSIWILLIG